ncbi:hypothetical protein [Methylobacterium oxalidis]|uniref:hypothetical protein n=1 Tax=Methylobacterium oxalidis TaxID=944322 RepID=UPI003315A828
MRDPINPFSLPRIKTGDPQKLEGALDAPIIYFDEAPIFGTGNGVGRILLTAIVQDIATDGTLIGHRKVVAQLRGSAAAFEQLRTALDRMAAMSEAPGSTKN